MPIPKRIDNSQSYIDSRDIIARLAWLEGCDAEHDMPECTVEPGTAHDQAPDEHDHEHDDCLCFCECWCHDGGGDPDDIEEYKALSALAQAVREVSSEYHEGVTLIRADEFVDYARQYAEDIGAINATDHEWPLYCIDWDKAARELKSDYCPVDFGGEEYLVQSS